MTPVFAEWRFEWQTGFFSSANDSVYSPQIQAER